MKRKNQPEDHTMGVLVDYSLSIPTKDWIFSFLFFKKKFVSFYFHCRFGLEPSYDVDPYSIFVVLVFFFFGFITVSALTMVLLLRIGHCFIKNREQRKPRVGRG